jgi:hypothetical protein
MNDAGLDIDAENEFQDMCGFEYDGNCTDDEEDHTLLQENEIEKETKKTNLAREIVDEVEDEEDEDSDDEFKETDISTETEITTTINENLLTDSLGLSMHLRKKEEQLQQQLQQQQTNDMEIDNHGSEIALNEKRKLNEEVTQNENAKRSRVETQESVTTSTVQNISHPAPLPSTSTTISATSSNSISERALIEDSIKAYILQMGGRIKPKNLSKVLIK